jgi:hypothetical protein
MISRSFLSARGERAEFRAGLQAAPLQVLEFAGFGGQFDVAQAELAPDRGRGVGENGVEEGGDDADGFGGGVENLVEFSRVNRLCALS